MILHMQFLEKINELRLVIGGSGSGKSDFAEELLKNSDKKIYLATMPHSPSNEERIKRHVRRRASKGFITVEKTKNFSELELPESADILLEDLPNLLANEMFLSDGSVCEEAYDKVLSDLEFLISHSRRLVIVSDDIFESGLDYDPLTDRYMQILGRLHAFLSQKGKVSEIIAGIECPFR